MTMTSRTIVLAALLMQLFSFGPAVLVRCNAASSSSDWILEKDDSKILMRHTSMSKWSPMPLLRGSSSTSIATSLASKIFMRDERMLKHLQSTKMFDSSSISTPTKKRTKTSLTMGSGEREGSSFQKKPQNNRRSPKKNKSKRKMKKEEKKQKNKCRKQRNKPKKDKKDGIECVTIEPSAAPFAQPSETLFASAYPSSLTAHPTTSVFPSSIPSSTQVPSSTSWSPSIGLTDQPSITFVPTSTEEGRRKKKEEEDEEENEEDEYEEEEEDVDPTVSPVPTFLPSISSFPTSSTSQRPSPLDEEFPTLRPTSISFYTDMRTKKDDWCFGYIPANFVDHVFVYDPALFQMFSITGEADDMVVLHSSSSGGRTIDPPRVAFNDSENSIDSRTLGLSVPSKTTLLSSDGAEDSQMFGIVAARFVTPTTGTYVIHITLANIIPEYPIQVVFRILQRDDHNSFGTCDSVVIASSETEDDETDSIIELWDISSSVPIGWSKELFVKAGDVWEISVNGGSDKVLAAISCTIFQREE